MGVVENAVIVIFIVIVVKNAVIVVENAVVIVFVVVDIDVFVGVFVVDGVTVIVAGVEITVWLLFSR